MSAEQTYIVKKRPTDKRPCIYLRQFNVVVAEFSKGCVQSAEHIHTILEKHFRDQKVKGDAPMMSQSQTEKENKRSFLARLKQAGWPAKEALAEWNRIQTE
jgi:hypothetical protein